MAFSGQRWGLLQVEALEVGNGATIWKVKGLGASKTQKQLEELDSCDMEVDLRLLWFKGLSVTGFSDPKS